MMTARFVQGFAGGFTSRGFDSNGSNNQSFAQDITNLSATAGVLAKYSLAGQGIKLASEAMTGLREETISYTENVENLNITAGKDLSGVLTMESTARTYRYLDQNEIEEMRKTAAAAKAKSGAKP